MMKRFMHCAKIVFCFILCLTLILSFSFGLCFAAHHECSGENCALCAMFDFASRIISLCALGLFLSLLFRKSKHISDFSRAFVSVFSLVNIKVKLSN